MFSTLHLRFVQSLKGVTTQVNVRKVYTSCKIFTFDQRMTQNSVTKNKPGGCTKKWRLILHCWMTGDLTGAKCCMPLRSCHIVKVLLQKWDTRNNWHQHFGVDNGNKVTTLA